MRSVVLVLLLVGLVLSVGVTSAADPYGNDRYRIINVNSSVDGALSNFQVGNGSEPFVIEYDSDMQPDFDDIRMYYNSNMTAIPYFFTDVVNSTNASGYMNIDVPVSGGIDVRMYYGNSSLSRGSDIDATMVFGDEFDGVALNSSKWAVSGTSSPISISGGEVSWEDWNTQDSNPLVYGATQFGQNYISTFKMKTGDAGAPHFGFTTVTTNVDPWQNGDSVVFFPVRSANLLRTFNVNDGSGNSADDVGDIDESYHVYEIVRNGLTDTQFYQDGSLLETRTNNIPNADTHLYFSSHGIASGDHLSTMDYTFVRKYTANPPIITFGAEQLDTLSPDINTTLSTPINNTYTQFNNFTFNIVGNFTTANATLFIDSIPQWNGSITTGLNTAQNITLTEGMRSWYINASATSAGNTTYNQSSNESFYYDISNPTVPTVQINPDYVTISDGTIVNINLSWADNLQLKNGTFYIDTGSGYSEDSNTTLSGTSDWFNTSINTSGMVGNTITWKQEVYDQAGNNYTYSDSFYVALPNLLIYVYDETTGAMILPSDVVVFNEAVSRSATINGSTKISTLDYGNFTTGKYIVRVNADGYYTRRSIALIDTATVSSLNVYLPDVNESVIYDSFSLIDNTGSYNMSDIILRLDKPMPNGSDAVYQSYFDFDGSASTYLITDDMYKLFVITPDNTINYGWLNPDPDGDITIVLSQINIDVYFNDWLQVDYSADDDTRLISVTYESDNTIDFAFFTLLRNGVEVYNASALTDAGSFTYNASVDGEYLSRLDVYAAGEDFSQTWTKQYGDVYVPFLPDVYPQWMLNLISVGIIIIFLLAFGQYRADVAVISAVVMMGLTYRFGWLDTNAIVVSIGALIAASAVVTRMRKEGT